MNTTNQLLPIMKKQYTNSMLYIVLVLVFTGASAQKSDWYPEIREITVDYRDSVARFHVLINQDHVKVADNLTYFWYQNNILNSNKGGYRGMLLHGQYTVYNNKMKMITSGTFKEGLMNGEWKFWYPEGILKRTIEYKNGLPEGEEKNYDTAGNLIATAQYKSGVLRVSSVKEKKKFRSSGKQDSDSTLSDTLNTR